jgi:hypothetical protein
MDGCWHVEMKKLKIFFQKILVVLAAISNSEQVYWPEDMHPSY